MSGFIAFDPPAPQSCMIHVYLRGERAQLEAWHDQARAASGVRLWNAFRGAGHPRPGSDHCYFEWSIGANNCAVDDVRVREGWRAFLRLATQAQAS